MTKRVKKQYSEEFRREAVALITKQGYSVSEAASSLGVQGRLLYHWKAGFEAERSAVLNADERAELIRLRKENQTLKMEKDILKKASALLLMESKPPLK